MGRRIVTVPFTLLGGTVGARLNVVQQVANRLNAAHDGEKVLVSLVTKPPQVDPNPWVDLDIAMRGVMLQERMMLAQSNKELVSGEFENGVLASVSSGYDVLVEMLRANSDAAQRVTNAGGLVGIDGKPIMDEQAILANQLAGAIMYAQGLLPAVYGAHGGFWFGGIYVFAPCGEQVQFIERLVAKKEDGTPLVQRVPTGDHEAMIDYLSKQVIDTFQLPAIEIPRDADAAAAIIVENIVDLMAAAETLGDNGQEDAEAEAEDSEEPA